MPDGAGGLSPFASSVTRSRYTLKFCALSVKKWTRATFFGLAVFGQLLSGTIHCRYPCDGRRVVAWSPFWMRPSFSAMNVENGSPPSLRLTRSTTMRSYFDQSETGAVSVKLGHSFSPFRHGVHVQCSAFEPLVA